VLALTRCLVPDHAGQDFLAAARETLSTLAERPGYLRGSVGRAIDEPGRWVLATEWDGVGSYRRGLSAYDVKLALAPIMRFIVEEPSAYDVLASDPTAPAAG
jgi:heme oxygenase (mycobilin-producing)